MLLTNVVTAPWLGTNLFLDLTTASQFHESIFYYFMRTPKRFVLCKWSLEEFAWNEIEVQTGRVNEGYGIKEWKQTEPNCYTRTGSSRRCSLRRYTEMIRSPRSEHEESLRVCIIEGVLFPWLSMCYSSFKKFQATLTLQSCKNSRRGEKFPSKTLHPTHQRQETRQDSLHKIDFFSEIFSRHPCVHFFFPSFLSFCCHLHFSAEVRFLREVKCLETPELVSQKIVCFFTFLTLFLLTRLSLCFGLHSRCLSINRLQLWMLARKTYWTTRRTSIMLIILRQ